MERTDILFAWAELLLAAALLALVVGGVSAWLLKGMIGIRGLLACAPVVGIAALLAREAWKELRDAREG